MSRSITLSGGSIDGMEMEVADGIKRVTAVNESDASGFLVRVAYSATADPTIWAMRPLTDEEQAEIDAELDADTDWRHD